MTVLIFSLPLWLGLIVGALQGKTRKILFILAAILCFIASASFTRRYFRRLQKALLENHYPLAKIPDTRRAAVVLTTLGVALLSFYLTRKPTAILLLCVLAALGYYLNYFVGGSYLQESKLSEDKLKNLSPTLREMLENGERCIFQLQRDGIRVQAKDYLLSQELQKIVTSGQKILVKIAASPEKIRAARQVLVIYLPELVSICETYLGQSTPANHQAIRDKFAQLLHTAQSVFTRTQFALDKQTTDELDSQIDALRQQLNEQINASHER